MLTDVLIPPARTGRNEAAGDGGDGVEPKPTPGQTHNRHLPAPHRPMRSLPTVIRSGSSGHQPGVSAIAGPWPLTPVEPGVTCRPGVPWRTAMGNAPGVRCHGTGLRTDRFTMRLRALRSVRTAQPRMGSDIPRAGEVKRRCCCGGPRRGARCRWCGCAGSRGGCRPGDWRQLAGHWNGCPTE